LRRHSRLPTVATRRSSERARTVVERIIGRGAGGLPRRGPVSLDRTLLFQGRGRAADVQSLLNGGQRNFSRVFDLFRGVRHVESEDRKSTRRNSSHVSISYA